MLVKSLHGDIARSYDVPDLPIGNAYLSRQRMQGDHTHVHASCSERHEIVPLLSATKGQECNLCLVYLRILPTILMLASSETSLGQGT